MYYYLILHRRVGMPPSLCTAAEVSSYHVNYHKVLILSYPFGTNCLSFLSSLFKSLLTPHSPSSPSSLFSSHNIKKISSYILSPLSFYSSSSSPSSSSHTRCCLLTFRLHLHPSFDHRIVLLAIDKLLGTSRCYKKPADCGITKTIHDPA